MTQTNEDKLLYKELSYKVQGAFFEVWNELGSAYKENVYQKALIREFNLRKIPFETEKSIDLIYKGEKVGVYRLDFVIDDKIILEIKAQLELPSVMESQLYYYLKATKYKVGYLVNFGSEKLDIRRRIYTKNTDINS